MERKIDILLLEDSLADAELVREILNGDGLDADLRCVDCERDFRTALQESKPDLIISDYSLPSYDGHAALAAAQALRPETPFIYYSGTIGEESAIDALKQGATDYVLKQRPKRLVLAIRRALDGVEQRTERREAERQILAQARLLDLATDAIVVRDMDGQILFWNRGAERLYGFSRSEATGKHIATVTFRLPSSALEKAQQTLLKTGYWQGELEQMTKDERTILVMSRWTLVLSEAGEPEQILAIDTDITEMKQLEQQFLRAQRLESIGTLASGIAHDLNNILAPVFMGSEALHEEKLSPEGTETLKLIQKSAERGAGIVKQVLTFVRGGEGKKTTLLLEFLINDVCKVARDTFPKFIEVCWTVEPQLWPIQGDVTQLHQVLMNLCINARDAMPDGGNLVVSAKNLVNESGSHVLVEVADSGTGIPPEILDKIFDPFFSTKEIGKGTGLGLSTVLGIVKSHGGTLQVQSKVGIGTTFQVLLPAQTGQVEAETPELSDAVPRGDGELILVVDDETEIRRTMSRVLQQHGYEVLTAHGGGSGVVQFAENRSRIKLVITDIMMPGGDGSALMKTITGINPRVKIIVTTGLADRYTVPANIPLVKKPFSSEALLRAVFETLRPD